MTTYQWIIIGINQPRTATMSNKQKHKLRCSQVDKKFIPKYQFANNTYKAKLAEVQDEHERKEIKILLSNSFDDGFCVSFCILVPSSLLFGLHLHRRCLLRNLKLMSPSFLDVHFISFRIIKRDKQVKLVSFYSFWSFSSHTHTQNLSSTFTAFASSFSCCFVLFHY